MRQSLARLDCGLFCISDDELAIVCTESTSLANPELIGLAFATRTAGWRILRRGLADIGYAPDRRAAVTRIIIDAERHGAIAKFDEATKRELPT